MVSLSKAGKIIARNATILRRESGLSRLAFAQTVGISRNTQKLIEQRYQTRARYTPSISTVMKLAQACNVSVEDFISLNIAVENDTTAAAA